MPSCRVCDSKSKIRIYRKYGFNIVRCNRCDFIYTDFNPNSKFLKNFYSKNYFVNGDKKLGYDDYAKEEVSSRMTAKMRIRSLKLKERGLLLDVGCAYGYFLSEMPARWQKYGLEISTFAYKQALKNNPTATIKNKPLTRQSFIGKKFDLITLWDVIEHLGNPQKTSKIAYQKLKRGGQLVMSTGDISSLFSKLQGKHWHLLNPPQHLSFFSPKTVTKMLKEIGFSDVKVTHPPVYYPISYLAHKLETMYSVKLHVPNWMKSVNIPINLGDIMMICATK